MQLNCWWVWHSRPADLTRRHAKFGLGSHAIWRRGWKVHVLMHFWPIIIFIYLQLHFIFILNSWFRASWFNVNKKVQLDATVCRHLFTEKSLYTFRASQHPSSGALKTVTATSGIGHNTGTATSFQRGLIIPRWKEVAVPVLWPIPEVAVTFLVLLMMGAVTPETCRVTLQ